MESGKKDVVEKKDVLKQPKKSYSGPKLTIHGTVEEITADKWPLGAPHGEDPGSPL